MYKSALRSAPQRIARPANLLSNTSRPARRFLSTAPPSQKRRTWKSSFARWTLAAGAVYYYNTSDVFAEEPEAGIRNLDESINHITVSNQPTLDAILEEKNRRRAERVAEELRKEHAATEAAADVEQADEDGMEGLEEEADQQGAFNPETGEINWDCPCLGGMAHGPCGEEFKAAFSCFVYSNEEPKGMECIDKFKGMQDCFRQHPEMYGSELEDDEEEVEAELLARNDPGTSEGSNLNGSVADEAKETPNTLIPSTKETVSKGSDKNPTAIHDALSLNNPSSAPIKTPGESSKEEPAALGKSNLAATTNDTQKTRDVGGELMPKAAHDDSSAKSSST